MHDFHVYANNGLPNERVFAAFPLTRFRQKNCSSLPMKAPPSSKLEATVLATPDKVRPPQDGPRSVVCAAARRRRYR